MGDFATADSLARLHALGLTFVVENERLPTDRALTEADVRAAVERRNEYWIHDDFDDAQILNGFLVDADLVLVFLRFLTAQPPETLEQLKSQPLDLARPELKLSRAMGMSASAIERTGRFFRSEYGRWTLDVRFDADELARLLRVAMAEEPPRQQALDAIDARLAQTADPDGKLHIDRQNAWRRLSAIQRARLTGSRRLAESLGAAGEHAGLRVADLQADIARLESALKGAPLSGQRLPPPPPSAVWRKS